MPNTQPLTSDYETKRDEILNQFANHELQVAGGLFLNNDPHLSYPSAKQAIDNLVHQEVQKALDTYQHRMLKKNEDIIFVARIESLQWALNDYNMPDTDTGKNLQGFINDLTEKHAAFKRTQDKN